jgi:hypothetical protein
MVLRKSIRENAPDSEVFGLDEALAKMSIELMKPEKDKLYTLSDVTPEEIFGLSTILSYAEIFDSKLIKAWVKNFLLLRISRLRLGRKEHILLGSGMRDSSEKTGRKSITDLFSGLR